jgi:hypothetical protein
MYSGKIAVPPGGGGIEKEISYFVNNIIYHYVDNLLLKI